MSERHDVDRCVMTEGPDNAIVPVFGFVAVYTVWCGGRVLRALLSRRSALREELSNMGWLLALPLALIAMTVLFNVGLYALAWLLSRVFQ